MIPELEELKGVSHRIRCRLLSMHFRAHSGHIGSGLSAIDILAYVFWRWKRSKDTFILSKGHAASALYATLTERGLLSEEELSTYYQDGTKLSAHPLANGLPSIPIATGALGHGLSIATGMAYAHQKLKKTEARLSVLLSDGECNEGAVWEAALFAQHHGLSNLTILIDANGLQGFGFTKEVLNLEPLVDKWKSFGFATHEIDGHDFVQLNEILNSDPPAQSRTPRCLICRTVKGKGVRFMENQLQWHYWPMNEVQYRTALADLETQHAQ